MNRESATARTFPPLAIEPRSTVTTEAAAFYLNRKPQTLRAWACEGTGPIRPLRIHSRLAWKVADIQAVLNGDATHGHGGSAT